MLSDQQRLSSLSPVTKKTSPDLGSVAFASITELDPDDNDADKAKKELKEVVVHSCIKKEETRSNGGVTINKNEDRPKKKVRHSYI